MKKNKENLKNALFLNLMRKHVCSKDGDSSLDDINDRWKELAKHLSGDILLLLTNYGVHR